MGARAIKNNVGINILKVVQVILGGIYILVILFYLGLIVPEYLACVGCDTEGAMGTDIWGDSVQCFGDSKVFGQVLFDLSTVIIVGLSVILSLLFLWRNLIAKNQDRTKNLGKQ
ncbi:MULTISPECIES: hypothetical protein [Sphingobacterium]|uniref:DUF2752 domain-containing protein n=1 Tax=Sphingobacterium ginsenosidimutans TaxID=687845 RepID=A0ABP8A9A2_9SPHI|nr:hypothetical protein [Sphingobacterium sp. E70]ULT25537.1 hypothetical protein KUH03_00530 [Sphingobacterium sp. E70]